MKKNYLLDTKLLYTERDKYCRMYAETNAEMLPKEIHRFHNIDDKSFIYGIWSMLEILRKDGLLHKKTIDKYWREITSAEEKEV